MKRKLALVLALVMVLSMIPMSAFALATARTTEVPVVADDATNVSLATLTFREDSDFTGDLQGGKTFTLTFPTGVKVKNTVTDMVYFVNEDDPSKNQAVSVDIVGDYTVNVTLPATDPSEREQIQITPIVTIDGFEGGEIQVTVDSFGAGIPSGKYTLGRVQKGSTSTTVLNTRTIGEEGGIVGTVRITENSNGSLEAGDRITLTLPRGFEWDSGQTISLAGGFAGRSASDYTITPSKERLTIDFESTWSASSERGIIQITPDVDVKSAANTGDITVRVSGDATDAQVVVGTYADYEVIVKADGDARELIAGRHITPGTTDNAVKLQTLVIDEKVADSLNDGRRVTVELPRGVKILTAVVEGSNIPGLAGTYDHTDSEVDKNEFEFDVPVHASKQKIEITFYVSIQADFTGDIAAKVSGRGGAEGEAVLGVALAPLTVSTESKDLRIGVQNQEIGEITITEAKDEVLAAGDDIFVELNNWVVWNKKPVIEVVEGDLEIEEDSITITSQGVLQFEVKRESSEASTFVIKGGTVDVSRSVPEGAVLATISGDFIENDGGNSSHATLFATDTLGDFVVAKVVTPAPGETATAEVVLTIGSATMFVDGVAEVASAAPYIDAQNRTMLPVSAIGRALGADVDWNAAARTVLITKDNNRVLLTIGSDTMNVNGMMIPMRSEATITGDRTFVPVRDLGVALGVATEWDAATRTVTIK